MFFFVERPSFYTSLQQKMRESYGGLRDVKSRKSSSPASSPGADASASSVAKASPSQQQEAATSIDGEKVPKEKIVSCARSS